MITLKDLFPNWIRGGGILKTLSEMYKMPWSADFPNVTDFDVDYFGTYGDRGASPLAISCFEKYNGRVINDDEKLVVDDNGNYIVTASGQYILARIIYHRFSTQWSKLYSTMKAEYNPIENYSMTETEKTDSTLSNTRNESATNTNTGTVAVSGTNTGTVSTDADTSQSTNLTDTTTVSNNTVNSTSGYKGFNSTDFQDVNSNNSTANGTTTVAHTGTVTGEDNSTVTNNLASSSNQSNNLTDTHEATNTDTGANSTDRTLTRSGNIGVTTSQQMLEAERQVWLYDYFNTIYKELNTILTIPYYNC